MAEAFFNHLAAEKGIGLSAESAGTMPGATLNPDAVQVMDEIGVPMEGMRPKLLNQKMEKSAKRLITMGCGVEAAACPAGPFFTDDWGLDDPAGLPIEKVREIRDQIQERVSDLIVELESAS